MKHSAVIIGASGLVGGHLIRLLLQNEQFTEIRSFGRTNLPITHSKLIQYEVDFEYFDNQANKCNGDVFYCCIGTTIRKAGSQDAFRKIDFEIPLTFAKIAEKKNAQTIVVVSSLGANAKSSNFYLRTKGAMENAIEATSIPKKVFVQPSLLLGKRPEFRFSEKMGEIVLRSIGYFFFGRMKKYKAIKAETVAIAMINSTLDPQYKGKIESDSLVKMAKCN